MAAHAARSTDGVVAIAGSARGQLFQELFASVPDGISVVALTHPDGSRLDISDQDAVDRAVDTLAPSTIINAAAWTGVDTAESQEPAAHAVNAIGPACLARAALRTGAHLVHVSTDFVFGEADGRPFGTQAPTAPLGAYGRGKRDGEVAVRDLVPGAAIVRTAWVYSAHGNNFVKTMLRLMAERDELGVVADQIGSPTWANSLAHALWRATEKRSAGTFHWTGAGVASWYDFACAILEQGRQQGLLTRDVRIRPLTTAQYPTPAARPPYSVLDLSDTCAALEMQPAHWRDDLSRMLGEIE